MTPPIPAALRGRPLVVADVEGNGQQPPEIVEIAVLTVDDGATGNNVRSWLVKPEKPITSFVRKIHGISNEDVANCPPWTSVAAEVEPLLSGRTLIAHSASVEHRVIGAHLPGWQPALVLDTLRLAKHVWPDLDGYGLDKLVTHTALDTSGINEQRYHRAAYDTWCAWQLLCVLVDHGGLDWDSLVKIAALPGFAPQNEPEGLW